MADKKIRVLDLVQPLLAGGRMRSSLGVGCRPKGVQLRRSATFVRMKTKPLILRCRACPIRRGLLKKLRVSRPHSSWRLEKA
jgi:hypothetical protein